MTPTRRLATLIVIAVAMLVLAILVFVHKPSFDTDLLAIIGLLGGIAVVIVALPQTK